MDLAVLDFQFIFIHQPNTVVTSHNHDSYELVYYFEGSGSSKTPDGSLSFAKNSYSIYPPEVLHDEYHKNRTSVYCIGFRLQPICNVTLRCGNYPDPDGTVREIVNKVKQEAFQHQAHYKEMINLQLSEFLYRFDRGNLKDTMKYDDFYKIKQHINENIGSEIDMQELADLSGYSYHYFRHLFKMQTGLSPKQYIIQQRLEYSKILLVNSPESVLNIAQTCGFSCSSQFDIIFRRYTGKSPVQFRSEKRRETLEV